MLRMRWSDGMGAHCCGPAMARTIGESVDAVPHLICDGLAWSHRMSRNSSRYRRHSTDFAVTFLGKKCDSLRGSSCHYRDAAKSVEMRSHSTNSAVYFVGAGVDNLLCQEQQAQRQERR